MNANVTTVFHRDDDPNGFSVRSLPTPLIVAEQEIRRPTGYAIPGFHAMSVTVDMNGDKETGYGEGPGDLPFKKATSEAIERLALRLHCRKNKVGETSNGWAAHVTPDLAIRSAFFELIERDVALTNWENGGPFFMVPMALWPAPILDWVASRTVQPEYHDLEVFLGHSENGACISALLFNGRGNFVVGHASSFNLDDAIISAVNECFRAAHLAIRFEFLPDVIALHSGSTTGNRVEPGAHSLAYAYRETMPESVLMEDASAEAIMACWGQHQATVKGFDFGGLDISLFQAGAHFVARVKGDQFREIFWGRSANKNKRNLRPHFVG